MARYYGFAPSEIEGLGIRDYMEYFNSIGAVDKAFRGEGDEPDGETDPLAGAEGKNARDMLTKYGIEVPNGR
jgi:hypothetical protein